MALYKGSIEIAGAGFGGNSSSIAGGSGGGVIDGSKYVINPSGTGENQYKVVKSLTIVNSTLVEAYTVQNDCGLYIESPFSSDVLFYGLRWYINDINSPIYSMAESQQNNAERQGVITFVKAGSKIYVNRPDSVSPQTGDFTFIEYKLNSLNPQVAFPDYSAEWTRLADLINTPTASSCTVTKNGFLHIQYGNGAVFTVYINEKIVCNTWTAASDTPDSDSLYPVSKGDVISWSNLSGSGNQPSIYLDFIPAKTVVQYEDESETPLIDWDYVEDGVAVGKAKSAYGSVVQWKHTNATHNQIYSDGRYANYVYPLKEDFTNFKELRIVFRGINGTPDIACKVIKTRDFDWMLSLPKNPECTNLYTIITPNSAVGDFRPLWIPYCGCAQYATADYNKSTKTKLKTHLGEDYYGYILEIYGIGRK